LVTVGRPKFTPKTAPSLRRSPPHLILPSFDWPHSRSQTASGSTQPFCNSTLSDRHTDAHTQTDRYSVQWRVCRQSVQRPPYVLYRAAANGDRLLRRNKVPNGYNGTPKVHLPPNCLFPSTITTKSNTPIPSPTPLTIPNGIRIQSPVSPLLTSADRQMARTNVRSQALCSAMLIVSDALKYWQLNLKKLRLNLYSL